ncbi:MAG: hypothetical protein JW716_02795 [Candidatus Aenigmarchaeota archaeon]|nr:hypothetical protein [Candidatus Aenigmarchaeota archaeon]
MKSIDSVIKDIKSLKIQGANAVALSSVEALRDAVKPDSNEIEKLEEYAKKLILSRPTEPFLRNCISYIQHNFKKDGEDIRDSCDYVIAHIKDSDKLIAEIGENKIKDGMSVFTHCHSSTVMSILKLAKDKGKNFIVYNTETRPFFQGRTTAKELADYGIEVSHMVDSAGRIGIKKADMALIGCDAITSEGRVINKIGSELFAEIASRYDVPFYVCSDSWKLDPASVFGFEEEIEQRNPDEVWEKRPKNVTIFNPAFEIINPGLVTGIISEMGVFRPELFVDEVQEKYPFLFLNQKI